MSAVFLGGLLGFLLSSGVAALIMYSPPLRRPRLADRVGPYVGDLRRESRLLATDSPVTAFGVAGRLLQPHFKNLAGYVERIFGGTRSVRRRLVAVGSTASVEDFRVEQVMWGVGGAISAFVFAAGLSVASGSVNPIAGVFVVLLGSVVGVLSRDWWLSVQVRRREEAMLAEFPVVAELLALAVTAGESPAAALDRVCRLCRGELARELGVALAEARAGASLPQALESLAERTTVESLARFVDGVVIALERGTPLADVLRAQASDVREAGKRALMAAGGRKEVFMMVPVVFLILPITVLFALYPGLVNITLLTK